MTKKKSEFIALDKDPLWYKNGVIYQLHVRAYADSDGNGVGDFRGLTEKLDYLQDLGVSALWLLPFYPSPLKDDGYDIADYYSINPIYGTLGDFKNFLKEAHRRGLRVITELVINHTSDQHPWFQKSRRAKPGSAWRDFYVWSDTPERYQEARIIFKDFEHSNWTWDPVAHAYFWHRFYSHQPDLNFDNPAVHRELIKSLEFWLDLGVDGLRLDAVPYLYEREGTNCENLSETHQYLKKLRMHLDEKYGDRMLLAEANQWPEDAVAYFGGGKGDECHMAFHFPLMPRLFMALRMEDRLPIVDILEQTPPIPETSQWALFLRNHDELTLEMVTDEERDYMYRVYANDLKARINLGIRRRLAPLLGNDRKRIELMNALLFSLPGTPVLYYGDEIGMGDNIFLGDRNGVRTPMHWSSDKNAGFSRANPQSLYLPIILDPEYHYEAVNVEAQQRNPHSLLWWMKRFLALRNRWKAFGQGTLQFLQPENRKVLAYVRRFENECVLVVANLSRFPQPVALDLDPYKDSVPFEMFGRTEFPPIEDQPYLLTLNPHAFLWFSLEPRFPEAYQPPGTEQPELAAVTWEGLFQEKGLGQIEKLLAQYIKPRRWFRGKARQIKSVKIRDAIPVAYPRGKTMACLVEVEFTAQEPELYQLPLSFMSEAEAEPLFRESPHLIVSRLKVGEQRGILYDSVGDKEFCKALLELISRRRTAKGQGELEGLTTPALRAIRGEGLLPLEPSIGRAEQSNSAVIFGDKFFLKLFRKLEPGINPDFEIGRFLTDQEFAHAPPLAGAIQYSRGKTELMTSAVLYGLIPGSQDAWEYTLESLGRYIERVNAIPEEERQEPGLAGKALLWTDEDLPPLVTERIGTYIESARLLGVRTADLHLALASETGNPAFAPEPFTPFYQRSLYQSFRNQSVQSLQLLRKRLGSLPEGLQPAAETVLSLEGEIVRRFRQVFEHRITGLRIRIHGDYHLGQVLYTGKDFFIMDFEGEPARSLGERRIKRSPIRDVAGMVRSFHYATHAALLQALEHGRITVENAQRCEPWIRFWNEWIRAIYIRAYRQAASQSNLLPGFPDELNVLLNANLLDKAIYELGYELNNRPDWVALPLQGILDILEPLPA